MDFSGVFPTADLAFLQTVGGFNFDFGADACSVAIESLSGDFYPMAFSALVLNNVTAIPNIDASIAVKVGGN